MGESNKNTLTTRNTKPLNVTVPPKNPQFGFKKPIFNNLPKFNNNSFRTQNRGGK